MFPVSDSRSLPSTCDGKAASRGAQSHHILKPHCDNRGVDPDNVGDAVIALLMANQ
jgi:hypothetical protein